MEPLPRRHTELLSHVFCSIFNSIIIDFCPKSCKTFQDDNGDNNNNNRNASSLGITGSFMLVYSVPDNFQIIVRSDLRRGVFFTSNRRLKGAGKFPFHCQAIVMRLHQQIHGFGLWYFDQASLSIAELPSSALPSNQLG